MRRIARMPDLHKVRLRSENAEISAGVDHTYADAGGDERFRRAINREPFGDPAEIDREGAPKTDAAVAHQNDIA